MIFRMLLEASYADILSLNYIWYLPLVHPCDTKKKGGCSQTCKKTDDVSGYVCTCGNGFKANGKSCDKGLLLICFANLYINLMCYI